jgi:uncharacterized membrane protein YphA (DoxX/SURF4 family)
MQPARQIVPEAVPQPIQPTSGRSNKSVWAGRILGALPVLLLVFSAVMKLIKPPVLVQGFQHFGLPISLARPLGILELACAIIYVIPRTAVLGAILITGYMGGAILTHLRLGEPWIAEVLVGVFAWGGIFLRDRRVRALIPLRRDTE